MKAVFGPLVIGSLIAAGVKTGENNGVLSVLPKGDKVVPGSYHSRTLKA
jgi:hypothetical protein